MQLAKAVVRVFDIASPAIRPRPAGARSSMSPRQDRPVGGSDVSTIHDFDFSGQ